MQFELLVVCPDMRQPHPRLGLCSCVALRSSASIDESHVGIDNEENRQDFPESEDGMRWVSVTGIYSNSVLTVAVLSVRMSWGDNRRLQRMQYLRICE